MLFALSLIMTRLPHLMKNKGKVMSISRQYSAKSMSLSSKSRTQGFTLLEVMVVVVIIAVMGAMIAPKVIGNIEEARISTAKSDITNIKNSLQLYKMKNIQYPSTDQGLDALVSKPSGDPEPKAWSKMLDKTPVDPWDNPYKYLSPGSHGDIDIYSWGPDGRQSDDDIGSWDSKN
jgi:general secretion pathway protein G